jgi:glutathione-independent formaldehyde dehydrogenase
MPDPEIPDPQIPDPEIPDPEIVAPTDVLVRITTTNVCGSDLHYEGRTDLAAGRIIDHENPGEVVH